MTRYSATDLGEGAGEGGWEFKILRSATGAFKKPEALQRILEEEGRAGWVMIEKFDSQRVRVKRPSAARSGDASLGFDPYRTTVGISEGRLTLIIMACVFAVIGITVGIIFIATRK
ncbi:MAG: hypothetical protein IT438_14635 [Phycisphaerales bacterium]|nr:hypothetical protein [Phycisphaerales bacterium]